MSHAKATFREEADEKRQESLCRLLTVAASNRPFPMLRGSTNKYVGTDTADTFLYLSN